MERFYGIPLKRLNSITKFPSIPTLHTMEKGNIKEELQVDFSDCGELHATEKIDGTNCRVIIGPNNDFIVGSREELLYAKGDFISTSKVVDHILPTAHEIGTKIKNINSSNISWLWVFYFEVFGGNIQKHKNYTSKKEFSSRLIDIMSVNLEDVKNMEPVQIAGAREDLSRTFQNWFSPMVWREYDLNRAPEIALTDKEQKLLKSNPSVKQTLEIMENIIPKSLVYLDNEALKQPEGLIIRDEYKNKIAKIKFKEYKNSHKHNRT